MPTKLEKKSKELEDRIKELENRIILAEEGMSNVYELSPVLNSFHFYNELRLYRDKYPVCLNDEKLLGEE